MFSVLSAFAYYADVSQCYLHIFSWSFLIILPSARDQKPCLVLSRTLNLMSYVFRFFIAYFGTHFWPGNERKSSNEISSFGSNK